MNKKTNINWLISIYSKKMIVPHYNNLPKELKEQMINDLFIINDNDRLIKL